MPRGNGHRSRQMWEARGRVYVYMAEIAHAAVGGRRGHKPKEECAAHADVFYGIMAEREECAAK